MKMPQRKRNRLQNFDYSSPNTYYITICSGKRRYIFWEDTTTTIKFCDNIELSIYGNLVEQAISEISVRYPLISVDKYVIMPDHVHILLTKKEADIGNNSTRTSSSSISTVVQQFKGAVSKKAGFKIWQKGFYDHVVRNEYDYNAISDYIASNPTAWIDDHVWETL